LAGQRLTAGKGAACVYTRGGGSGGGGGVVEWWLGQQGTKLSHRRGWNAQQAVSPAIAVRTATRPSLAGRRQQWAKRAAWSPSKETSSSALARWSRATGRLRALSGRQRRPSLGPPTNGQGARGSTHARRCLDPASKLVGTGAIGAAQHRYLRIAVRRRQPPLSGDLRRGNAPDCAGLCDDADCAPLVMIGQLPPATWGCRTAKLTSERGTPA
jgi:hypothetical protein